jgi:hypothetical protein
MISSFGHSFEAVYFGVSGEDIAAAAFSFIYGLFSYIYMYRFLRLMRIYVG